MVRRKHVYYAYLLTASTVPVSEVKKRLVAGGERMEAQEVGRRSKNTWKVVLENHCAHANELRACHYLQQAASIEVLTDQPTFLTN